MIFYILGILHILFFGWAFYNILYFGIKPAKSLSWIFFTFFFPFLGVFVFILFGINRRKIKYFQLKETKKRKHYLKESFEQESYNNTSQLKNAKSKKIATLIYNNTKIPVEDDNEVIIIKNGKEAIKKLCEAIDNAKKFIHLQYYILEEGKMLDSIVKSLLQKREEGVEVRILYDFIGSFQLSSAIKNKLKEKGVEIYPETPFRFGSFLFSLNYRNHRKITVIDNEIALTGGVNIADEYVDHDSELGIWEDTHLQIQGCAVNSIHKSFIKDFYYATNTDLSKEDKYITPCDFKGETEIQIVSSGPDYEQSVVMQQYLSFINLAEEKICVFNPYFIPTFSILEAFKVAALSGVEVELLLSKKTDSKMATYSMYSYFEDLLKAGVNIYLRDDFSHSKVIFIDDEIMSVGSTNFDCRSFEHNYELNTIIYSEKKTAEIKEEFEKRKKEATKLDLNEFRKRSSWQKTWERLARFLSPLL